MIGIRMEEMIRTGTGLMVIMGPKLRVRKWLEHTARTEKTFTVRRIEKGVVKTEKEATSTTWAMLQVSARSVESLVGAATDYSF